MQRQPSCCDFCGLLRVSHEYPIDSEGINWCACLECARLIDAESWDLLMERGVAACAQTRVLREDEELAFRKQMEELVNSFRVIRLATA